MVEIPTLKPYIFTIKVTRQIKCLIAQAPAGHTPPLPEVNFLMVEIPTPKPYIYIYDQGGIDKLNAPRVEAQGHPHPLPEVFLRITHISETILSILTKLFPNVPWVILFQRYVWYV
jgi:hypothetical protein